ncbi:DMT family transporter [Amycolatopsis dongchuanensis]|uniref:DMT family transporter n=1 Tax=Amycolatopsis dongchuanensis TaxID=1070866 RepID=A0ABP9R8X8_9PSEU
MERGGQFAVVVQFCLLALAWGASFLFIKIGLTALSPAQVVWSRLVFGALALVLVAIVRRTAVPREPALWGHLAVVSVLLCVVPFLLFAWAEQRVSSGLAAIYNGTTPLTTTAFAAAVLRTEKLTRDRAAGLVLGFLGVLLIIGPWSITGQHDLLPQLACLGATTCYGLAFAYLRRFVSPRGVPAPTAAFVQVTVGAVLMLAATPFLAADPITPTWPVVLSMIALGRSARVWPTSGTPPSSARGARRTPRRSPT